MAAVSSRHGTSRVTPAGLFILALVVHSGALAATFYLDDARLLTLIEGAMAGTTDLPLWRTATWLLWSPILALAGANPFWLHVPNWLLHAVNTVLLYGVVRRLAAPTTVAPVVTDPGVAARWALFTAGLFAVHPLFIEVTHYARAIDSALLLLVMLVYLWLAVPLVRGPETARGQRWRWPALGALTLGCWFLALLCKAHGLALFPLAAALLVFVHPLGMRLGARFPVLAAYAVVAAGGLMIGMVFLLGLVERNVPLLGVLAFRVRLFTGSEVAADQMMTQLVAWSRMLGQSVAPFGLAPDAHLAVVRLPWAPMFLLGLALVLLLPLAFRLVPPAFRSVALAAWVLLVLQQALYFIYLEGEAVVVYRWYTSGPGLMLLLGLALLLAGERLRIGMGLWVLALLALTLSAFVHSAKWASPEQLNREIIAQFPTRVRPLVGLANHYFAAEDWPRVIALQDDVLAAFQRVGRFNETHETRRFHWFQTLLHTAQANGLIALAHAEAGDPASARRTVSATARLLAQSTDLLSPRAWRRVADVQRQVEDELRAMGVLRPAIPVLHAPVFSGERRLRPGAEVTIASGRLPAADDQGRLRVAFSVANGGDGLLLVHRVDVDAGALAPAELSYDSDQLIGPGMELPVALSLPAPGAEAVRLTLFVLTGPDGGERHRYTCLIAP